MHRHKWPGPVAAPEMQRPRNKFLTGTGGTGNEHGGVGVLDSVNQRENLAHGAAGANHFVRGIGRRAPGRGTRQTAFAQDALNHQADFVNIEWLGQVISGPELDRLDGRLGFGNGRDHDDRHGRRVLADLGEHFQPALVRQFHVQQHQIKRSLRPQRGETGLAIDGGADLIAVLENEPQRLPRAGFVVNA